MVLRKRSEKPNERVVRIQKFSDGLFIRIPKKLAEDIGIDKGDYVKIIWNKDEIIIKKV